MNYIDVVINILCRRHARMTEKKPKKPKKLILIESISGSWSGEQAEFISDPHWLRKTYRCRVFRTHFADELSARVREYSSVNLSLFLILVFAVAGNAVFRRNYVRDCWISNFVPCDAA